MKRPVTANSRLNPAAGYDTDMTDGRNSAPNTPPEAPSEAARLTAAVEAIRQQTDFEPEIAVILGSGLGPLADEISRPTVIPYDRIPGFVRSSAPGHSGELYLGELAGRKVVAMKGRMHYYDGISPAQAAFPVRVMNALGAGSLLVSNACGGLNPAWSAGDLMLQLDFINHTSGNPLIGPDAALSGPRFPVMFDCYDPEYLEIARHAARQQDQALREGIYLAISGPSYATRAELRAYRSWGADAIGMSTVYEVIVARHVGMRVLGLSCVTDMALPDLAEHATGEEVVAMAGKAGKAFRRLVTGVLPAL
jgi:purine-nucleoside phosphorylase